MNFLITSDCCNLSIDNIFSLVFLFVFFGILFVAGFGLFWVIVLGLLFTVFAFPLVIPMFLVFGVGKFSITKLMLFIIIILLIRVLKLLKKRDRKERDQLEELDTKS